MIPQKPSRKTAMKSLLLITNLLACLSLSSCDAIDPEAEQLTKNVQIQLIDWHISGLWVINSPVAWVRINNYNDVPIHEITFEYKAAASDGKPLDHGTFTIEGSVPAHGTKNFVELYLGLVDLYTEKLSIQLLSVHRVK